MGGLWIQTLTLAALTGTLLACTDDDTSGSDAGAPDGTVDDGAVAIPTDVPDPCDLLSADAADVLAGMTGLTAQMADATGSYDKACTWNDTLANESVRLEVGLAYPTTPAELSTWQQAFLNNEQGDVVDGVGDGAKLYLTTPSRIVVTTGYYVFWLEAYNGNIEVEMLLADAARLVVEALGTARDQ